MLERQEKPTFFVRVLIERAEECTDEGGRPAVRRRSVLFGRSPINGQGDYHSGLRQ